jgi:hypothetical protein
MFETWGNRIQIVGCVIATRYSEYEKDTDRRRIISEGVMQLL